MKWTRFLLLGAPITRQQRQLFANSLIERYRNPKLYDPQWEKIDDYVSRLLEVTINKAASLLTFNSIFAALSVAIYIDQASTIGKFACIVFTISCMLLMSCIYFFFVMPDNNDFSFESRVTGRLDWVFLRVQLLTCSMYISAIGVVLFLLSISV